MINKEIQEISNNLNEVIQLIAILNNKLEILEMKNNNNCNCNKDKFYSYLIREQNILLEEIILASIHQDSEKLKTILNEILNKDNTQNELF